MIMAQCIFTMLPAVIKRLQEPESISIQAARLIAPGHGENCSEMPCVLKGIGHG